MKSGSILVPESYCYCVASLRAQFSSELKSDFGDTDGDTEVRLSP